jgi:hypothetical protein
MSDLVQPASLASWPELGAELPASNPDCSIYYNYNNKVKNPETASVL